MDSIRRLAVAAVLLAAPAFAWAQSFPSKPITLICPWPAGGTTDAHLRKFAEVARKYLGQPVVVDNKPGGGGMIGPSNMAKLAKQQLDQVYWYKSSREYAQWAAETLQAERATIERVGLLG